MLIPGKKYLSNFWKNWKKIQEKLEKKYESRNTPEALKNILEFFKGRKKILKIFENINFREIFGNEAMGYVGRDFRNNLIDIGDFNYVTSKHDHVMANWKLYFKPTKQVHFFIFFFWKIQIFSVFNI